MAEKKKKRESPKTRYRMMLYADQLGCKTEDEALSRLKWILSHIKQVSRFAGIMHDMDFWTVSALDERYPVDADTGERPVNPDTQKPYEAGDHKRTHFHVCIWLNEKVRRAQLVKLIEALAPSGAHLAERNFLPMDAPAEALMYLTHANRPHKHQYEENLVFSNFDWKSTRDGKKKGAELESILSKIESGEITKNNVSEKLKLSQYVKYRSKLRDAFEFYDHSHRHEEYSRICVYVTSGISGSGKSINAVALAKYLCARHGWDYFYGGEGLDIWGGYKQQEVVILDDKSFGDFTRDGWLSTFDLFAKGSASSRFQNKIMKWRVCIVTNIQPFEEQVEKIKALDPTEDRTQFRRRFQIIADVQKIKISLYSYQFTTGKYELQEEIPNAVLLNTVDEKSEYSKMLITEVFEGFRGAQVEAYKKYLSRHGDMSKEEVRRLKTEICDFIDAQYSVRDDDAV